MGKEALEKVKAILKARDKAASSSVIQVWQSDLYDFRNSRITLLTIAFLQMNDNNSTYPEDAPKEFRDDRVGWCWASQRFIAERAGKSESQAHRDIKQFVKDGVIETRSWTDSNKTEHLEYHVLEDVVAAHQRVKDAPRPKRSKRVYEANKGSFTSTKQPLKGHSESTHNSEYPAAAQPLPPSSSAVGPPAAQPSGPPAAQPLAHGSAAVVGGCSRSFGFSSSSQADDHLVPASRGLVDPNSVEEEETPKPGRSLGAGQEQQQPRKAGLVTKPMSKPLPNRLCYPELYADWLRRKTKRGGVSPQLPKCRRCGDTLFWEENHVCEGFVPKYPDPEVRAAVRSYQTFDDFDGPEEDDLSGYEDFDDDQATREEL